MRTDRLAMYGVSFLIGAVLAGCGGGGGGSSPSAPLPTQAPVATPTPTASVTGTTVVTAGSAFALPAPAGYTTSVTLGAGSIVPSGTTVASLVSAAQPATLTAFDTARAVAAVRTAKRAGANALGFLEVTPSAQTTIAAGTSLSLTVSGLSIPSGYSVYAAVIDPSGAYGWQYDPSSITCAVAGTTATCTTSQSDTLLAGHLYAVAYYTQATIATPSPSPTASSSSAPASVGAVSTLSGSGGTLSGILDAGTSATLVAVSEATPTGSGTVGASFPTGSFSVNEGVAPKAAARAVLSAGTTLGTSNVPRATLGEPDTSKLTASLRRTLVKDRTTQSTIRQTQSLPTTVGATANIYTEVAAIGAPTAAFTPIPSVLVTQTAHANIWVDQSLTQVTGSASAIAQIAKDAENAYLSDTTHFGSPTYTVNAPGYDPGPYQACNPDGSKIVGQTTVGWIPPTTDGRFEVEVVNESALGSGEGGYFSPINYIPQALWNCTNGTTSTQPVYSNEAPFIFVGYLTSNPAAFELDEDLVRGTAHELQHLDNFVNHVLDRNATDFESSWIDEGFAVLAQDLAVPTLYPQVTNDADDAVYRAQQYLANPQNVSIAGFTGIDPGQTTPAYYCSACYGGSFLFERYLYGRFGGDAYLKAMYASGTVGNGEIASVTGVGVPQLMSDFGTALAVSNTGLSTQAAYQLPGLNVRGAFTDQFGNKNVVVLNGPTVTSSALALGATATHAQLLGAIGYYQLTTSSSVTDTLGLTDLSSGALVLGGSIVQH